MDLGTLHQHCKGKMIEDQTLQVSVACCVRKAENPIFSFPVCCELPFVVLGYSASKALSKVLVAHMTSGK